MKLKSKVPNRVVNRRVNRFGRWYVVQWFKFDDKGYADIDESKLTKSDINKLKAKFDVVEEDLKDLGYKELQIKYADKTGKSAVGMKKKDILKELEG